MAKHLLFLLLASYMFLMGNIFQRAQTLSSDGLKLTETRTGSSSSTAIFLHLGYLNLWPDMLTCARNAVAGAARQKGNGKVDVFVSVTSTESKSSIKANFSNISMSTIKEDLNSMPDIGDVVVKEFDNSGADIGPFIKMLAHGDIASRNYDFVLKMHSNGDRLMRSHLIKSLCGSPEKVSSILDSFEENHEVDMIVPKGTVFGPRTDPSRIMPHLIKMYNIIEPPAATFDPMTQSNMNDVHNLIFPDWIKNHDEKKISADDMAIAATTMFWIRYSALHPRNLADALPKLEFTSENKDNLGVEHAIQRLLATEIILRKRKIAFTKL